jgi:hypothetical protein
MVNVEFNLPASVILVQVISTLKATHLFIEHLFFIKAWTNSRSYITNNGTIHTMADNLNPVTAIFFLIVQDEHCLLNNYGGKT